MATRPQLFINAVGFDTRKGSIVETRATGLMAALPRVFGVTLDVVNDEQEDMLLWSYNAVEVAVTMPDGQVIPRAIIMPSNMPARFIRPRRIPIAVDIEIQEVI